MSRLNANELLAKERKRQGITQRQLADELGMSVETIKCWEQGRRNMTLNNADKVFRALGVTVTIGGKK